jgi:hypothetical protein
MLRVLVSSLAVAAALMVSSSAVLAAPIIGLCNTGTGADCSTLLAGGAIDPHYELIASAMQHSMAPRPSLPRRFPDLGL